MERRVLIDKIASRTMLGLTLVSILLAVLIAGGLYLRSQPLLETQSVGHLLSSSDWKPSKGEFGFFPFIMGTLWVTSIAILIALPLCILTAVYLSEYAHHRIRKILVPFIDMLSGIPPIVFGVWGVLFVIPLIREYIGPWFGNDST